jgi:hypothetical protein
MRHDGRSGTLGTSYGIDLAQRGATDQPRHGRGKAEFGAALIWRKAQMMLIDWRPSRRTAGVPVMMRVLGTVACPQRVSRAMSFGSGNDDRFDEFLGGGCRRP